MPRPSSHPANLSVANLPECWAYPRTDGDITLHRLRLHRLRSAEAFKLHGMNVYSSKTLRKAIDKAAGKPFAILTADYVVTSCLLPWQMFPALFTPQGARRFMAGLTEAMRKDWLKARSGSNLVKTKSARYDFMASQIDPRLRHSVSIIIGYNAYDRSMMRRAGD